MKQKYQPPEWLKQALEQLKAGEILLFPSDAELGLLYATDSDDLSATIPADWLPLLEEIPVRLVADDQGLNRMSFEIPEIAWDLIDMAEKPLTIRLETGINPPWVDLRMVQSTAILQLLRRWRKHLIFLPLKPASKSLPSILRDVDYTVILPPSEIPPARSSALIQLGKNGEIKILRK